MKRQRRPRKNDSQASEAAADAASAASSSAHVAASIDALPPSVPSLVQSNSISVLIGSGLNDDGNTQVGVRNPNLQLQIPMSARGDAPPTSSFSPFTRVTSSTPSLQAASFRFQQSNLNMLLSTPAATPLGNASSSFMSPFLQTGASPYSTTFTQGSGSGRVKRRSQLESTRNANANTVLDTAASASNTNVAGTNSDFSASPHLVPIRTSSMMAPLFPHLDEGDETHASHGDSHDAGDTQHVSRMPTHSPMLVTASSLASAHASEGAASSSSAAGSANMNHLSLSIPQDDEARDILLHTIDYTPQRHVDQSNLFEGLYFQQQDASTGPNAASAGGTSSMLFTPLSSPARNAATGLHTTTAAAGQSNLFQFLPSFTPRFSRDMSSQLREGSRDLAGAGEGEMAHVSGTIISSNTGGAPLSPARSPARYLDSSSATAAAAAAFGCLPALPSPGPRHSGFQYEHSGASHAPTPSASSSSAFSNSMFNLNSVRALNSSSSSNLPILSSPSVALRSSNSSGTGLPSNSFSFSPTPSSIARTQRLSRLKQRAAKAGVNEYLQLPTSSANTPSSSSSRLPLLASPVHRTSTLQSASGSAFSSNLPDLLASPSVQYSKRRRLNAFHDDADHPMAEAEEASRVDAANAFLFADESHAGQPQHNHQHDHQQLVDQTPVGEYSETTTSSQAAAAAPDEPIEKPAKRQRRSKKDKEQVSPQPPVPQPEQSQSTSQEIPPQLPPSSTPLFTAENLQLQAQLAFMAQLHHLRIVAAMPHRATIVANAHPHPSAAQIVADKAVAAEAEQSSVTPPPIVTDYSGVPAPFIESAVLPSNPHFKETAPPTTEVATTVVVRAKKRKESASAIPTATLNAATPVAAASSIPSPALTTPSAASAIAPLPTPAPTPTVLPLATTHSPTIVPTPATTTIATPIATTRTVTVASIPPPMNAAVAEPANTILVTSSTSPVPVPASAVSTLVPSLNLLSSTALGAAAIPATIAPSAPAPATSAAVATATPLAPTVTAISVPMARTVSSSTPATTAVAVPAINAATPAASVSRSNVTTATAVAQPVAIRPSDAEKQGATPALAQSHNQPFIPQARTVLSTAKETVAATVVPPAPAIAASTVVAAAAPTVIATTAALPTPMQSATAAVNPNPLPAKPLLAAGVVTLTPAVASTAPVTATTATPAVATAIAAPATIAPPQPAAAATSTSAPTETVARVLQPSPGSPQITPAVALAAPITTSAPSIPIQIPTSVESSKAARVATGLTAPPAPTSIVPSAIAASTGTSAAVAIEPLTSPSVMAATPVVDFDRDRAAAAYMNMASAATSSNMTPTDFMNLFYASMPHVLTASAARAPVASPAAKKIVPAPKPAPTPQSIARKALQINRSNSSTMLLPSLYSDSHLNEAVLAAEGAAAIKIPNDDCKKMVIDGLQFLQRSFATQGFQQRALAERDHASDDRFVLPSAYSDNSVDPEASFDLTHPVPVHVELDFFNVQREALLNHLRATFPRELTFLLHRLAQHALFIHFYGFVAYQQNFNCPPAVPSVVDALSEGAEYREEKKVEHAIKKQTVKMKRKYDRMSKLTASTLLTMEDVMKVVSLTSRG